MTAYFALNKKDTLVATETVISQEMVQVIKIASRIKFITVFVKRNSNTEFSFCHFSYFFRSFSFPVRV
jgi:uncharacterized membrane protein